MNVAELTGEKLANILNEQYQVIMQAQSNLRTITEELKRRESTEKKKDAKK